MENCASSKGRHHRAPCIPSQVATAPGRRGIVAIATRKRLERLPTDPIADRASTGQRLFTRFVARALLEADQDVARAHLFLEIRVLTLSRLVLLSDDLFVLCEPRLHCRIVDLEALLEITRERIGRTR